MIEIRSLRDIVRLFFIFQREFRLAVIVTVIVAILGAFLLPSRFESEARLLVKPGRETSTLPIEYSDRQTLASPSTQRDPTIDEEKMLTGRPIIRAVAEYYLNEIPPESPHGVWKTIKFYIKKWLNAVVETVRDGLVLVGVIEEQTPADRLAKKLEKQFKVSHASGSMVMEISFIWDDPGIAQRVVDKWIAIYLEQRVHALGRKSLYGFYETESQRLAAQIAANKKAISKYLMTIDGVGSKERLESLAVRLNAMETERSEAYAEQLALKSGVASANVHARELPHEVTKGRELSLNPVRQDMELKLNNLELERQAQLKEYRDDAPYIRDLGADIAALKARIAQEKKTVLSSENRAPNELVSMLQRNALERTTKISELTARIKVYDKQMSELKAMRHKILSIEPELSRLEHELVVAEKNYSLYINTLEKSRIDRELDNSRISNIAIIEHATFSPARVFPKSLLILFMALPAGVAVGLLVLYLCYLLDPRIHDGGLVEKRFGTPLWGTVMEADSESTHDLAFQASLYRLYGLLPLDRIRGVGLTVGLTSARHGEGVSFIVTHLLTILQERKLNARMAHDDGDRAQPGELVLLDASSLTSSQRTVDQLKQADIILLVIEARHSTIPVVENALSILKMTFGRIDGIILNRRRLEIPAVWLARMASVRGHG